MAGVIQAEAGRPTPQGEAGVDEFELPTDLRAREEYLSPEASRLDIRLPGSSLGLLGNRIASSGW